jgi:hypothetical protein
MANIGFLQPYPVVAAIALLKICRYTAEISALISLYEHFSETIFIPKLFRQSVYFCLIRRFLVRIRILNVSRAAETISILGNVQE